MARLAVCSEASTPQGRRTGGHCPGTCFECYALLRRREKDADGRSRWSNDCPGLRTACRQAPASCTLTCLRRPQRSGEPMLPHPTLVRLLRRAPCLPLAMLPPHSLLTRAQTQSRRTLWCQCRHYRPQCRRCVPPWSVAESWGRDALRRTRSPAVGCAVSHLFLCFLRATWPSGARRRVIKWQLAMWLQRLRRCAPCAAGSVFVQVRRTL